MYKLDAGLTLSLQTQRGVTLEHAQRRSHNSGEQREGVCLDENEHHEEDSRECTIHHPGVNGYTKQLRLCRGREGEGLAPAAYQYDANSRECKTDLGTRMCTICALYSQPTSYHVKRGARPQVCVLCVCILVLCVYPHVLCGRVLMCCVGVSSPSCSPPASEWCMSPNQVGMCQCNGRGVS